VVFLFKVGRGRDARQAAESRVPSRANSLTEDVTVAKKKAAKKAAPKKAAKKKASKKK
jgi:hypothetical protein